MEPTLKVGAIIIVKEEKDVQVGDIITYRDSSSYTTHRIVEINDGIITTKGDANSITDKPISRDAVVGKVIFYINLFGSLTLLIKNPVFWIILVGILLIIFYFKVLLQNKKEKKNKRNRRYKPKQRRKDRKHIIEDEYLPIEFEKDLDFVKDKMQFEEHIEKIEDKEKNLNEENKVDEKSTEKSDN